MKIKHNLTKIYALDSFISSKKVINWAKTRSLLPHIKQNSLQVKKHIHKYTYPRLNFSSNRLLKSRLVNFGRLMINISKFNQIYKRMIWISVQFVGIPSKKIKNSKLQHVITNFTLIVWTNGHKFVHIVLLAKMIWLVVSNYRWSVWYNQNSADKK